MNTQDNMPPPETDNCTGIDSEKCNLAEAQQELKNRNYDCFEDA